MSTDLTRAVTLAAIADSATVVLERRRSGDPPAPLSPHSPMGRSSGSLLAGPGAAWPRRPPLTSQFPHRGPPPPGRDYSVGGFHWFDGTALRGATPIAMTAAR